MSCFNDLIGQGPQCATVGGIENVYLGIWSGTTTYSFDADDVVTGVTGSNTAYEYFQEAEFAGITQNGMYSTENKSFYVETILTLKFAGGVSKELRNNWLAISKAPIVAYVVSNEGTSYIAGVEKPGMASEGTLSLGVAFGDLNGGTISIRFLSKNGIYLIDNALIGTSIPVVNM